MTDAPVTVFVHIHYAEIWQEMCAEIERRLTVPFHLVLTSSEADAMQHLPQSVAMLSARRIVVENRGRDILPFLTALEATPDCDVGLKLHTKKSPQRGDGAAWRAAILDSLLPRADAATLIAQLQAEPRTGLVAPADFCLSVAPWVLLNAPGMVRVMGRLGRELVETDLDGCYFAAGSMFWFRRAALAALTAPAILALFEPEEGQLDGTVAHAMERLFPLAARREGLLSMAVPALMESRPTMTLETLEALAQRFADIPTSHFPGPGIVETLTDTAPAPEPRPAPTRLRRLFRS